MFMGCLEICNNQFCSRIIFEDVQKDNIPDCD
jgi:hypothetical protein